MRDERYKHVKLLLPEAKEMLFDLEKDPGENVDLMSSVPAEAAPLVTDLEKFVQLGQHGAHVALRGSAGASVEARIETESEIASAFRFAISTGDVLEIAPEGKRLTLKFSGDEKARHLVIQTSPPGAELQLTVRENGKTVRTSSLRMEDIAVTAADAERLLHDARDSVRVWYLSPGADRQRVTLDQETLDVLKALGYVQ
jgi:hypothetical protein